MITMMMTMMTMMMMRRMIWQVNPIGPRCLGYRYMYRQPENCHFDKVVDVWLARLAWKYLLNPIAEQQEWKGERTRLLEHEDKSLVVFTCLSFLSA